MPESEARVLTAGKSCAQVLKALSNGGFAALLARLRQEFDCVIIDSAPTLVVADGPLIGKLTDGVILVVRPKVSKAPAVYSAYEQLQTSLQIRTLGIRGQRQSRQGVEQLLRSLLMPGNTSRRPELANPTEGSFVGPRWIEFIRGNFHGFPTAVYRLGVYLARHLFECGSRARIVDGPLGFV